MENTEPRGSRVIVHPLCTRTQKATLLSYILQMKKVDRKDELRPTQSHHQLMADSHKSSLLSSVCQRVQSPNSRSSEDVDVLLLSNARTATPPFLVGHVTACQIISYPCVSLYLHIDPGCGGRKGASGRDVIPISLRWNGRLRGAE